MYGGFLLPVVVKLGGEQGRIGTRGNTEIEGGVGPIGRQKTGVMMMSSKNQSGWGNGLGSGMVLGPSI